MGVEGCDRVRASSMGSWEDCVFGEILEQNRGFGGCLGGTQRDLAAL